MEKMQHLYKIIRQDVATLSELVEHIQVNGQASGVEIELALRKVNDLYNELLLLKPDKGNSMVSLDPEADHAPESKIVKPMEPVGKEPARKAVEIEEESAVLEKPEVSEIPTEPMLVETESEELDKEKEAEKDVEKEVEKERDETLSDEVEEGLIEEDTKPAEAVAEEDVHAPDAVSAVEENTVDETCNQIEEDKQGEEDLPANEPESAVETIPVQEQEEETAMAHEEKGAKRAVLADKFQNNPSVNDLLKGVHKMDDLATKWKDQPISSLQKAIKINDRIWYIKELFNKDADLYKEVIEELDGMAVLDEALAFIFERFNWDQEQKSTVSFLELLFRRFANSKA